MRCLSVLFAILVVPTPPAAVASVPERVPAWFLELPDKVSNVLVADAAAATLHRFRRNGSGFVREDERYMSIGQNGVGKERAWDRKTPLGVYFITEEIDTRRLHEKYGVAAFALDYPNAWDRYRQRSGYGIWLHGVDRRHPERPPHDTDGCLALPNDEIARLAHELVPLETPLIVARELRWATRASLNRRRDEFRDALSRWEASIEQQDLPAYLSLYADDFRHGDMDKSGWAAWRQSVFAARKPGALHLRDLLLVADPEEPRLYLSRFTQFIEIDGRDVTTQKRLYWRRGDDGDWRIVTEDTG
jgi:ketosteroid isomerase-like protein